MTERGSDVLTSPSSEFTIGEPFAELEVVVRLIYLFNVIGQRARLYGDAVRNAPFEDRLSLADDGVRPQLTTRFRDEVTSFNPTGTASE